MYMNNMTFTELQLVFLLMFTFTLGNLYCISTLYLYDKMIDNIFKSDKEKKPSKQENSKCN